MQRIKGEIIRLKSAVNMFLEFMIVGLRPLGYALGEEMEGIWPVIVIALNMFVRRIDMAGHEWMCRDDFLLLTYFVRETGRKSSYHHLCPVKSPRMYCST